VPAAAAIAWQFLDDLGRLPDGPRSALVRARAGEVTSAEQRELLQELGRDRWTAEHAEQLHLLRRAAVARVATITSSPRRRRRLAEVVDDVLVVILTDHDGGRPLSPSVRARLLAPWHAAVGVAPGAPTALAG
jgi:hypothetical protein